jgi:prepilin-type N-terminal cleavage/methylation domain-containing protein
MTPQVRGYIRSQGGFTLVEVLVATAVAAILMVGLTSVVLTSWRASSIATSRVEASAQVQNFEFFAYDDFALSGIPLASGCPCTTQPIVLQGLKASNAANPAATPYQVTYTWDSVNKVVVRQAGAASVNAATDVSAFAWDVAGSAPNQTVVTTISITVGSYTETQTLQFHPRLS